MRHLKKYFWICKNKETGEMKELHVIAPNYKEATSKICFNKEWTPLEYTGWKELSDDNNN